MGFATAERGIYRPGETVLVKGMLRYRRLGVVTSPPKGTQAEVVVSDSHGKQFWSRSMPLSEYGTFSAEVPIDPAAALGTYSLRASANVTSGQVGTGASFRVEEYRPPQFKVDVTTRSADAFAGEALEGRVMARYLFGGAMPGATVRWTATRTTSDFQPPDNAGFAFGIATWEWSDDSPQPSTEVTGAGEGKTDAQGVLDVAAGKLETRAGARGRDPRGRGGGRQPPAHRQPDPDPGAPGALYAASASGTSRARRGGQAGLAGGRGGVAGRQAPEGGSRVTVLRRDWKFVRKKVTGDR
jgi:uncharacterized protein YfaS (alpha-2-macroglobulin family)